MEDLAKFRKEWQQELSQKRTHTQSNNTPDKSINAGSSSSSGLSGSAVAPANNCKASRLLDLKEAVTPPSEPSPVIKEVPEPEFLNSQPSGPSDGQGDSSDLSGTPFSSKPRRMFQPNELAALELFELAVDREHVGKMSDAVSYYREAFKIHDQVDKLYREMYFYEMKTKKRHGAGSLTASSSARHSTNSPVNPSGASNSLKKPNSKKPVKRRQPSENNPSGSDKGKTNLSIEPTPSQQSSIDIEKLSDACLSLSITPEVESHKCPLTLIPLEIIEYILCMVAVDDMRSFTTSLRLCKLFHFLGANTKYIWKTLAMREYVDQHYSKEAIESYGATLENSNGTKIDNEAVALQSPWNGDWCKMYKERPRLRFDGIYISTCNYLRPGVGESWYTPILMVTYYRYLRFYRDGTCISLLSTDEPRDVVPVFVRKSLKDSNTAFTVQRPDGTTITRPKGVVNGSWEIQNKEGDVMIETEGSVDRYMFHLWLNIRSSGGKKQNKLKWVEFWSINKITSDRADFSLKNDKAYFFAKYNYAEIER